MEKLNDTSSDQNAAAKSDGHSVKTAPAVDQELDDLLDSALQDFEKPNMKKSQNEEQLDLTASNEPNLDLEFLRWEEEFLSQAKMFEQHMPALLQEAGVMNMPTPENFTQGLAKMAESAAKIVEGKGLEEVEPQVVDSITQALKGLKEGSDNLQSTLDPDEIAKMFNGLDINEAGDSDSNPFMPFVQGMMQSLLSAEVLLPSLKELQEKYPSWMEENKEKISVEDRKRFIKQQELFKVIIAELEQEKADDPAPVKNERFKRVLENMQKLHEFGQPPAELVGGEPGAMPQLPGMGDPSQCTLM